jgi:hypothetical protein
MVKSLEDILRLAEEVGRTELDLPSGVTSVRILAADFDELNELRQLAAEIREPQPRSYTIT